MEGEHEPSISTPIIKRRTKGIRTSGSNSSLRSLSTSTDSPAATVAAAAAASSSNTNAGAQNSGDAAVEDDDEGTSAVVFRHRGKKTPAGRIKEREAGGAPGSKPKQPSRLSFGASVPGENEDDDAESSFAVKRSSKTDSPARKLLSIRNDALPQNLDQASISSSSTSSSSLHRPPGSVYSNEYLNELKRGTLSTPPPTSAAPVAREGYDDLTMAKFGAQLANDDSSEMNIPTTAAIASAKARRERMRQEGPGSTGSDGYISLTVGHAHKGGESRLVREEDEIGDGAEDGAEFTGANEVLPLGKKANKEAAMKMRNGMMDMINDAEDEIGQDDEEAREWEEAQIRRAEARRDEVKPTSKPTYTPAPIPQASTLPTLSGVQARLAAGLHTLESSHTLDAAALTHFAHERAELDTQEKELREEVLRVEEKNRWFGDFRAFIEDVAAFLDEKFPSLERIEKENLAIQKERYEIVARRRFEDDSDDVALFTGATVPSRYGIDAEKARKEEEEEDDQEPEVDELGRSRRRGDDEAGPRSGVRVARRTARDRRLEQRRAKIEASANGSAAEDVASWTDDDLGSADAADLADALVSLQELRANLFADVKADDFRDPNLGIRKRFEEWRTKFREDYDNAFGGLALVGVWEFWAGVEMALWNPFEIDQLAKTPSGLDSYHWHSSLTSYGHGSARPHSDDMDADDDEPSPDESSEVVNALVTSVVIPRLAALARASYDPFSRRQTARALALVDEVSYCVETTSPKFESLIQAFFARLQHCVAQSSSLISPYLAQLTLPSNAFDPSTFVARERFLSRQLKLVQNAQRWRRYARLHRLPSSSSGGGEEVGAGATFDELIQRELVGKVLLPVIEASWGSGGQMIADKVVRALPKEIPPALRRRLQGESE